MGQLHEAVKDRRLGAVQCAELIHKLCQLVPPSTHKVEFEGCLRREVTCFFRFGLILTLDVSYLRPDGQAIIGSQRNGRSREHCRDRQS